MMVKQALIVYYSQFNNTTKLAKLIQDATKAPALRLHVADSVYIIWKLLVESIKSS